MPVIRRYKDCISTLKVYFFFAIKTETAALENEDFYRRFFPQFSGFLLAVALGGGSWRWLLLSSAFLLFLMKGLHFAITR
jgi:hypothetical protein